jgi:hypothetical protein
MFKMNFRQKLIFYVHPGTVPTQRAAPKRNLFFQIGRNLQKKTTVPLHSVFSPHHVASGDVNLNNMDHMPNILFSAFSVFHHPVRSVKAKHSYIPPKIDNGRTKKFELVFQILPITNSSVHVPHMSIMQKHVRLNNDILRTLVARQRSECPYVYRDISRKYLCHQITIVRNRYFYSQNNEYKQMQTIHLGTHSNRP